MLKCIAHGRWIELAAVDKLANELAVNIQMAPMSLGVRRPYAGPDQGSDRSLEASVVRPVGAVVVASVRHFTLGPG